MGTLISRPQDRASFQVPLFPAGIDRNRSNFNGPVLGTWRAAAGASFRAGQPVMLNAQGEIVVSDGSSIKGVAGWDKVTQLRTVVVDAPVVFGTSGATRNLLPNILANSLMVRSAVQGGGTLYTVTTDYTVNLVNGTITHVGGGSITAANTVYVTYARTLTEEDVALQGRSFQNTLDYVTWQDGRIAVIEPPADIFTTEYDTDQVYTLTGATSNVYVGADGLFTSSSSSTKLVGRVIQVPSNGDPYLGISFSGQVVANT